MARTPRRREAAAAAPAPRGEGGASRRTRENLPRPAAAPARPPTGGAERAAPARRRSPFSGFGKLTPRFIGDIISELRKVTWPTFAETRYLTFVVAIVAIAVGFLLGGVDLFFGWIIGKLFF